jgi:DNA-binding IclR family transcriptional regulator
MKQTTEDLSLTKTTSSIQVIDRMVALLDSIAANMANNKGAASLKFLSADTGLHTSTAFRILAALQIHGLIERDAQGAYCYGSKMREYGSRVRVGTDLRQEALPIMEQLRDATGETINLTAREGDEVVYIERALSHRIMRVEQVIGSRAPLHVTAVGKLMLAENGHQACIDYAARSGLVRYTANTLTDIEQLLHEADTALANGYAHDNEEAELGVACIGVLIRDAGNSVIGGLSISAPRERHESHWIGLLVKAGKRISQRMGYNADNPHLQQK